MSEGTYERLDGAESGSPLRNQVAGYAGETAQRPPPGGDRSQYGSNVPDLMARIREEQRALAILRALDGEFGPWANDEVLAIYLTELALACPRRELLDHLSRLERSGLVSTNQRRHLLVVELTRAGAEVAQGIAQNDLVARVVAGCPY